MYLRLNETQERTVYNALAAWPNYAYKYGTNSAFLELKLNFRLTNEEMLWILDKLEAKGYINEFEKQYAIESLQLKESMFEGIRETSLKKVSKLPHPLDKIQYGDTTGKFYIFPPEHKTLDFLDIDCVTKSIPFNSIYSGQYYVEDENLENIDSIGVENLLPIVTVKYKDKYYLFDGNHRAQLVYDQGKTRIEADVYEYEDVVEAYQSYLNSVEDR